MRGEGGRRGGRGRGGGRGRRATACARLRALALQQVHVDQQQLVVQPLHLGQQPARGVGGGGGGERGAPGRRSHARRDERQRCGVVLGAGVEAGEAQLHPVAQEGALGGAAPGALRLAHRPLHRVAARHRRHRVQQQAHQLGGLGLGGGLEEGGQLGREPRQPLRVPLPRQKRRQRRHRSLLVLQRLRLAGAGGGRGEAHGAVQLRRLSRPPLGQLLRARQLGLHRRRRRVLER